MNLRLLSLENVTDVRRLPGLTRGKQVVIVIGAHSHTHTQYTLLWLIAMETLCDVGIPEREQGDMPETCPARYDFMSYISTGWGQRSINPVCVCVYMCVIFMCVMSTAHDVGLCM